MRRAAPGDVVRVSDGRGRVVEGRLAAVSPARVEVTIVDDHRLRPPSPPVEVYLGLAKNGKVDQVIRPLVELGVDAVTVFSAGRSVARWDPARASAARLRWGVIAREAAKQSHRAWLPDVAGPLPSAGAAGASAAAGGGGRAGHGATPGGATLGLIAHPGAARPIRQVLEGLEGAPGRVWLAVGPEGGLAPAEVSAFANAGGATVTLGSQILRAETAPIVLASLVLYQLGRFGG